MGKGSGVIAGVGLDSSLRPEAFVAETVQVYAVSLSKPVTLTVLEVLVPV